MSYDLDDNDIDEASYRPQQRQPLREDEPRHNRDDEPLQFPDEEDSEHDEDMWRTGD
jgi:hypothetical protein